MNLRQELPKGFKRIVIKMGSLCVTQSDGGIRLDKLSELVADVAELRKRGLEVILVTSGAINAGKPFVKSEKKTLTPISRFQACSAVGQPILMHAYQELFQHHQLRAAQVLLTHDDIKHPTRYLNLQSTLEQLLTDGIIPILNENDSVSFEEISLGDNDQLAAMVCELTQAEHLLLLTDADGLFDQNPQNPKAKRISLVAFDDNFEKIKMVSKTLVGRGGMQTKILAVRKLTPLGVSVIIATHNEPHPIHRAMTEQAGSFFEPAKIKISSRKKARILARVKTSASILVDEGAYQAILKNASVLPVGVKGVEGTFKRGDAVEIKFGKKAFAFGVSEFDAKEIDKIQGKKSQEIEKILGFAASSVVVHRDNLALKDE